MNSYHHSSALGAQSQASMVTLHQQQQQQLMAYNKLLERNGLDPMMQDMHGYPPQQHHPSQQPPQQLMHHSHHNAVSVSASQQQQLQPQHQQQQQTQHSGVGHSSQAPNGNWATPQQSHYATMQSHTAYMAQPVSVGTPHGPHVTPHQQAFLRQAASQSSWTPPQPPYTMQPPQYLQNQASQSPSVPTINSNGRNQSQNSSHSSHFAQQNHQPQPHHHHHHQVRQSSVPWHLLPTGQSYYQTQPPPPPSAATAATAIPPSASRTQFPTSNNAYMTTDPTLTGRNNSSSANAVQQRNSSSRLGSKSSQVIDHNSDSSAGSAPTTPWSTPSPSLYGAQQLQQPQPQQRSHQQQHQHQQQSGNQNQNNSTSSYYSNSYDTTPLPYHSSHHHSAHHAYQLGPSHTSTPSSSLDHPNSGFSSVQAPPATVDTGINPQQYWGSPVQSQLAPPTGLPHTPLGMTNVSSNVSSGSTNNSGLTQQSTHGHGLHRQSPAASPLPSARPSRASNSSRASNTGPPSVRTPDRCPSIGNSSSLAQLEQMVMPHLSNSEGPNGPNSHPSSHRSYTSSPVVASNTAGPNSSGLMPTTATSSGPGGPLNSYNPPYDHSGNNDASSSSASNSVSTAASYGYSAAPPSSSNYGFSTPYDNAPHNNATNHSGADIQKAPALWSESTALLQSYNLYEPSPPTTNVSHGDYSSTIMSASSAAYGQHPLLSSVSTNDMSQSQSSAPSEVNDPYAIDANTFSDYNEPPESSTKKSTKGRPKKTDADGTITKRERKPRAPRAPKTPKTSSVVPNPTGSQQLSQSSVEPSAKKRKGSTPTTYVADATNSLINSQPPPPPPPTSLPSEFNKAIEGTPTIPQDETLSVKSKKDCSIITEWVQGETFNSNNFEVDRVISNKLYEDWAASTEEKVLEEPKVIGLIDKSTDKEQIPELSEPLTDEVKISEKEPTCEPGQDAQEFRDSDQAEVCEKKCSPKKQHNSRRGSSDKKDSFREGLMREHDFVIAYQDIDKEQPLIWRIEAKNIIQKFEPVEQAGILLHQETSIYQAWDNRTPYKNHTGVDVRITQQNSRTKPSMVELIGVKKFVNKPYAEIKSDNNEHGSDSTYWNNFQVYIQSLLSIALDRGLDLLSRQRAALNKEHCHKEGMLPFWQDIEKEQNTYFLDNVRAIDEILAKEKSKILAKLTPDQVVISSLDTYPCIRFESQDNANNMRCRVCNSHGSTQLMVFEQTKYDSDTFDLILDDDTCPSNYPVCHQCMESLSLYSELHHFRWKFFIRSTEKLMPFLQDVSPDLHSNDILDLCFEDESWMNKIRNEFESLFGRIKKND
ncbi:hypothetical protein GZH46_01741 [Fragariocoptes setiger]|uniref:DUF4211 domain-containing protein n=1 Tax=Fragariocoptes setiger TaxID=1670756 RepID=A0ABQ7S911_9ACAR|nr:hypothetical protein GZH46_01741 [Fragariocoptes setiger]